MPRRRKRASVGNGAANEGEKNGNNNNDDRNAEAPQLALSSPATRLTTMIAAAAVVVAAVLVCFLSSASSSSSSPPAVAVIPPDGATATATGDSHGANHMWADARDRLRDLVALGQAEQLHAAPDVFIVPHFISEREADGLARVSEMYNREYQDASVPWCFKEYIVATRFRREFKAVARHPEVEKEGEVCISPNDARRIMGDELTFSISGIVPFQENARVDAVGKRAARVAGLPLAHAYNTQLLTYESGHEYSPHVDCTTTPDAKGSKTGANDRAGTVILYLNDVEKGGGTTFTSLNITVKPTKGAALIWGSLDADGVCDVKTMHRGDVVAAGRKMVLQRWWHKDPITSPFLGTDEVVCDNSLSCRHYLYSPRQRAASRLTKLGVAAVETGDTLRAVKMFREAVKQQPNDRHANLKLIRTLRKAGKNSDPEVSAFRANLADMWLEEGNFQEAVVQYTRAAEAGSGSRAMSGGGSTTADADYFCRFAAALKALGRMGEAERKAERCLELDAGDAENAQFRLKIHQIF